ncbi:MAG: hypothetical protein KDB27_25490 [Planctomycetales bacterium]|nr:hypothetical protein [Planctomycetales bacterium]
MEAFIKIAIFLIIILFSAIGQFLKERPKKRRQDGGPQNDGRELPPRPQANVQGAPQNRPNVGGLEAEIEDFLRQVTGQSAAPPAPTPKPRVAEIQEPMYVEPEVIEAEITSRPSIGRESVAAHVKQHLGDAHLASKIELRDEKMDSHLHEVFDHRLSSFDRPTLATKKKQAKPSVAPKTSGLDAAELLKAFQSPEEVRKAIILKEILTPKSFD